jgi:TRAP transporter TAXI family solute receptor
MRRYVWLLFRRRHLPVYTLLAALLAGAAFYYFAGPAKVTVAVGPPGSAEARLIEAYATVLEQQHAKVRVRAASVADLKGSAEALERNEVDLAVVRPDVRLPVNALSVAILREEAAIVAAPQASKIEDVPDLAKKRLGLIARHPADRPFLDAILVHYDLAPPTVTVVPIEEAEVATALTTKKVDAIAFVASPTGAAAENLIGAVANASGGKMKVIPVAEAEALAQRSPALTVVEIPAGAIKGRPRQPEEEIKTVGVSYRLMARSDLDRTTVAQATQDLFQYRPRLAVMTPAANELKALDTDTATGAALPIHPGAIDYFAREQLTFMERYGDWLWLALFSMGGVSSAAAWLAQHLGRKRRELIDVLLDRLLKILADARDATTVKALDDLALELDRLVVNAVKYARNRTTNARSMSALILGIDSARAAIADRRRDILDHATGTAETSAPGATSLAKTAQASRRGP